MLRSGCSALHGVNPNLKKKMPFELDYSCNCLSFKVDMLASCEPVKANVLMRQKQRIFHMMEYNHKTKVSNTSWFAKKTFTTCSHYNVFWLLKKLIESTALTAYLKWLAYI